MIQTQEEQMAAHHFLPSHRFSSALSPLLNCFQQQTITIRKVSSFLKNITKPNIEIRKKKKKLNISINQNLRRPINKNLLTNYLTLNQGFLNQRSKQLELQSTRDLIDLRNPSQFAILVIFFYKTKSRFIRSNTKLDQRSRLLRN